MFHDHKNDSSSQVPGRAAAYHHGSSGIALPAAAPVRKAEASGAAKKNVIQGQWEREGFNLRWNPSTGGDKSIVPEGYTVSLFDPDLAYPIDPNAYSVTQHLMTQYPMTQFPLSQYPPPQFPLSQFPGPAYNPHIMSNQGPGNMVNVNTGVGVHGFPNTPFIYPPNSRSSQVSSIPIQMPYGNMPQQDNVSGMMVETPFISSTGMQPDTSDTKKYKRKLPEKKGSGDKDKDKEDGPQSKKKKKLTSEDYKSTLKEQWGNAKGLAEILTEYETPKSTHETQFNDTLLTFLKENASDEGSERYDLLLQLFLHGNFNGYDVSERKDRLSYFKYLISTEKIELVTTPTSGKISSSGAFDWDGSKESLMPLLLKILKENKQSIVSVIEPFGGTGQLLQHMDIPYYAIADLNPYLIKFYETLASDYHLFEVLARQLQKELRASADKEAKRKDVWSEQQKVARDVFGEASGNLVKQALAFLYLQNQTNGNAWNIDPEKTTAPKKGKLKVNQSEQWINRVWPGKSMEKYYESMLKFPEVRISTGGFQDTLKAVFDPNTMIYLDSPYPAFDYKVSKGQTGQYTSEKFDQSLQYASIAKAGEFLKMGMTVVLSNYANPDLIQKCIDNGAGIIYIAPVHHYQKRFPEMIAVFRPAIETIPAPRSDAPIMQWFDGFGKVYAQTAAMIESARKELKILAKSTKQQLVDTMDWQGLKEKQLDIKFLLSSWQADNYELIEDLRFRLSKEHNTAPDNVHAVAEELIKNYKAAWDVDYKEILEIINNKEAEKDQPKKEDYKEELSGVDILGNLLPHKTADEDDEEGWDDEFMITLNSYFPGGVESHGATGTALGILLKQFHSNQGAYINNRLMPLAGSNWLNYTVAQFLASFFKSKFKFYLFEQDQITGYFEAGNGMTYSIGHHKNEFVIMMPDNLISQGDWLFSTCYRAVFGKPMEPWMQTFLVKMCTGEITEQDIEDAEWACSFLRALFE